MGLTVVGLKRRVELTFRPWPPVPGLRALPSGSTSAGSAAALVGIGDSTPPPALLTRDALCEALFDTGSDAVPVAFFTDHYCPNCREMAATLDAQDGIDVTRHELPLLGPASETAARAALAAEAQGARTAFHARMRRATFLPTQAYLASLAEGLGLDVERFLADIAGHEVERRLARSVALARRMGFGAVPATLVGRTVVVGAIPPRTLDQLVRVEAEDPAGCPIPA